MTIEMRRLTPLTLDGPLPTSHDPRVASENFTAPCLHAIVSVTGREAGPLSRHPAEAEVAPAGHGAEPGDGTAPAPEPDQEVRLRIFNGFFESTEWSR